MGQAGLGALDFNIWDPAEQERWESYFRALGKHYRNNPNVLCYELFNEPDLHNYDADAPGSEFVREAFRKCLAGKFGTISALNEAWQSEYSSLDEILPAVGEPRRRLTPLDYAFRRFRRLSLAAKCLEGRRHRFSKRNRGASRYRKAPRPSERNRSRTGSLV
ncbi:beta-galactosidase [bacterium]|nr:beta-galactosidase [bacterium]